jgi:hypothetical protein
VAELRPAVRARRAALTLATAVVLTTTVVTARAATSPIQWTQLRNPVLSSPDLAVKDPALVRARGRWWAVVSAVSAQGSWRVGVFGSPDLQRWPTQSLMPHDPTVEGEASPDVTRERDGVFVVTYQSFVHDVDGAQAKLYYRTTRDFSSFSPPHPLAHELHPGPGDRMIDAAIVRSPTGLLLGYKTGVPDTPQHFEIARSTTGTLDGPWEVVGRPDIVVLDDTIENYQFLHLDGKWMLLATSNAFDRPYLFELRGNPGDAKGWLHWSKGRELKIPKERWNTGHGTTALNYEHANSAFLVDAHRIDGWYYLVYADAPEVTTFGGAGHNVLALARSRDLGHWTVPPH